MTPLLPLIHQLASLGDELVAYATSPFAAAIERAGAVYRPYHSSRVEALTQIPDKVEEVSLLLMSVVGEVLAADLSAMRDQRPDYIVTDSMAPWGQWIGQLLSVPVVTSVTTFAINRHVLAFAGSHGVRPKSVSRTLSKLWHVFKASRLRRRLSRQYSTPGLGVFNTVFGRSGLNIVHTSREFQPCGDTFDESFVFVGPPAGAAAVRAGSPVEFLWPTGTAPIVYVSLGTLFNANATFYRDCVEALRHEPVRVIVSIGARLSPEEVGASSENVTMARFVPQIDVLEQAAVFITHGGMNSVSESLCHGVPMLTVPQMGEQEIVSRRVEQLGAGLYLAKEETSAETLRISIRRLLSEDSFKRSATRIGETLRAAGGRVNAAQRVSAFANSRP